MGLDHPSPNFGDRKPSADATGICMLVIHYTGMETCDAALSRLCDPDSQVSAHLLIDEDGTVHRLVADEHRAWHAGVSYWRGITDINSASIGIELVNPGHEFGYQPFPEAQINCLIETSLSLVTKFGISPAYIVGHSDIAPGRKEDPGELFPWQRLASEGLGLWPDADRSEPPRDPWRDLAKIGYATPHGPGGGSDILIADTAETDVIAAFQRRFRPKTVTGVLDPETVSLISAVAAVYP